MAKPQTWKDILQAKNNGPESNQGHNWVPVGQKGGVEPIRTYSVSKEGVRRSSITGFQKTPKTVYYKCKNCGLTGKKTIGGNTHVVPDDFKELNCDEVIIKDIIE